jgi:hypothetical protein
VTGTRLESLPSGNHVVEKYRVDGTLLSEMPVQEYTRTVGGESIGGCRRWTRWSQKVAKWLLNAED